MGRSKRGRLPPSVRRLIVDLKAEYPRFNLNELANVVRAGFVPKADVRSVARMLEEEPMPLNMVVSLLTPKPSEERICTWERRLTGGE